jgi:hypothetical protein
MREYIGKRLAEIESTEERALLKAALTDVFLPLYDETEAKYAALEARIRAELPLVYDAFTVYSTVLPRGQIDKKHAYLSPMAPEEVEAPALQTADILRETQEKDGQPVAETVFVEADYLRCLQIIRDKRILEGSLVADNQKFRCRFRLEPASRYMDKVEALYNTFLKNDVPWTTINSAYLGKFFDARIISVDGELPGKAEIQSVAIDYAGYADYVKHNMAPVWNVDISQVKGEEFPEPVEENINYRCELDIAKLGAGNAYLADHNSGFILSARREGNKYVIMSPQKHSAMWNLYRLRPKRDTGVDIYPYPVLSNKRLDTFSSRLKLKYMAHVATPAAIRTLLLSLEPSEYLEFVGHSMAADKPSGDTYNMNPFIRDELSGAGSRNTLLLSFREKRRGFFLNRDLLSFLVSEVQAAYPEYRCIGALA